MPCEECEVESYLSFPTAFSHISSLSPTEVVRQSIDLVPVYLTYKMCKVYVNFGNCGNDSEYIYIYIYITLPSKRLARKTLRQNDTCLRPKAQGLVAILGGAFRAFSL